MLVSVFADKLLVLTVLHSHARPCRLFAAGAALRRACMSGGAHGHGQPPTVKLQRRQQCPRAPAPWQQQPAAAA